VDREFFQHPPSGVMRSGGANDTPKGMSSYAAMARSARRKVRREVNFSGLSTISGVTGRLPGCCNSVTHGRGATCSLIAMQEITNDKDKRLEGGKYARTEEELYKKAIALLDKCKIESQSSGQEMTELEAAT
jgi:hypothetical protein